MRTTTLVFLGGAVALVAGLSLAPTRTKESVADSTPPRTGVRPEQRISPPSEWRAEIRAVRRKFAERRALATDDAGAEERFAREVAALLTDANTAAFVRSLTVEEANTPAGLAALERWLRIDARAAAEWIATRGEGTEAEALTVARVLLAEAHEMSAYCDALADSKWKQVFLKTAGLAAIARDPAAAIALAERMDEGAERANVRQTAAYGWMTRDPVAATKWLESVEDPTEQESLRAVAAKAIAVTDPELAARWLTLAVKGEGEFRDQALCIVETWAGRDPAQAAAWVARFPAQAGRDAAIDAVGREWERIEPAAAHAWIDALPDRAQVLARVEARRRVAEVASAEEDSN